MFGEVDVQLASRILRTKLLKSAFDVLNSLVVLERPTIMVGVPYTPRLEREADNKLETDDFHRLAAMSRERPLQNFDRGGEGSCWSWLCTRHLRTFLILRAAFDCVLRMSPVQIAHTTPGKAYNCALPSRGLLHAIRMYTSMCRDALRTNGVYTICQSSNSRSHCFLNPPGYVHTSIPRAVPKGHGTG
jgi:hypothetical protein